MNKSEQQNSEFAFISLNAHNIGNTTFSLCIGGYRLHESVVHIDAYCTSMYPIPDLLPIFDWLPYSTMQYL